MSFYLKLIYLKTINFLVNLNIMLKILLTLIICLLIFSAWYFKSYQSYIEKINIENQSIKALSEQKENLENFIKKFSGTSKEIKNFKSNINNLFEETKNIDQVAEEILQYAQSTSLQVNNFSEEKALEKKNYLKKKINFNLVGDFYNVLTFLETITNSCSVIKFNQFSIDRLKEGLLQINFTCSLYSPKD